jgi:hypothetical protein
MMERQYAVAEMNSATTTRELENWTPYAAKEHSNPHRPVERETLECRSKSDSEKLSEGEHIARRRIGQNPRIEKI